MQRAYYAEKIVDFLAQNNDEILGKLTKRSAFAIEQTQTTAWNEQIDVMKKALMPYSGRGNIYFEFVIPRLGRRIDVLVIIDHVLFVIEFKVGAEKFARHDTDQVCDYALDLKNFHETSHYVTIAPILVATEAGATFSVAMTPQQDNLLCPIKTNSTMLADSISRVLAFTNGDTINVKDWERGAYRPTPTIIEAATALYRGHSVTEISRSDAGAINLRATSDTVSEIIEAAQTKKHKAICFVTGVPGAGKTLVGLNIATKHVDTKSELHSVFLSGNNPLVSVLRETLARDKIQREKEKGNIIKKNVARSEVQAFIQNVHHFRDDCLTDNTPPSEHVALFDEAQRAWNQKQTSSFMKRKKGIPNFNQSEPEFLISCLERHDDWAVIVCLVGGGQEIHTGEAGIDEWVSALIKRFPNWHIYLSSQITDNEYGVGSVLTQLATRQHVVRKDELHLSTSMRSFRAESVSLLVKQLLDLESEQARQTLKNVSTEYPIVLTRDLQKAKAWLRKQARGSERYGMVVSSQAERLKPHAINVKTPMNPIHWFLNGKEDVRSSYYLEDVATEFTVQGLELDWACVTWDADFRYTPQGWGHWSFRGERWLRINKTERQIYQINAYRVLLTRARQGMVIVVPEGDLLDATRSSAYYDSTFDYLQKIGFQVI